jgi:hypothetical protein
MTGGKHGIARLDAVLFSFPCIWIVLFEILLVFLPSTFCCMAMRLVRTQIFFGMRVLPLRNGIVEPCYSFHTV